MAHADRREEAECLYVAKGMSCPAIASELEVDKGTVYRWKTDAAEKGGALDWDAQRRVYNMSPGELIAIYAEALKAWVVKIKASPELLSDPKIADAISKHISVMQKIDARGQYLGVAVDLIKVSDAWLAEHEPGLKEKMGPLWDQIYEALKLYLLQKGIF
jgi:transposase-like protein